jgi:GT2 family glycosyltransferase
MVRMATPVTLIIPNYNGGRYLAQTIESLLGQTFADFRLILLDDQSTDDSIAVAETFADPRFTIVRSTERVSMAGNWTRAANLAETPYFVLAHNDDVYEREYLEVMLGLIEGHPSAFMAHCKVRTTDEENRLVYVPGQEYKDALWPEEDPYERTIEDDIVWTRKGNIVIAPTVIYRTEAFRRIGPFDERFGFVTDWQYWLRGSLAGYTTVGTHRRLLQWRRHAKTATKAFEASLARFHEEIEVSIWIAEEVRKRGLRGSPHPDFELVLNTMLSEFASRLARGDRAGARAVYDLASTEIPTFRSTAQGALMRAGLATGMIGGQILKKAEASYLRILKSKPKGLRLMRTPRMGSASR